MHSLVLLAAAGSLFQSVIASPVPTPLPNVANEVSEDLIRRDLTASLSVLTGIKPTATPTAVSQAKSLMSAAYAKATPTGWIDGAEYALKNSLSPTGILDLIASLSSGINNPANINLKKPSTTIYPKKNSKDAPYTQSEDVMRAQIYFPSTYTYGEKTPLLLVPGTGGRGGQNFASNFIPLFSNVSYADPVWINPPSFQNADAQLNSETVAYAINYISAVSKNKKVNVVAWSQGNINVHWATKYWMSVRKLVTDHIAISPDYHGTLLADALDPLGLTLLPPSVKQQKYNSNYITALRSHGGDSAYVPTTNIYSGFFDEIVEPQQNPDASAILLDAHKVGVTNAEVQSVCGAGKPASFFETHESMLANPLTIALAVDALTHNGPGLVSRIDLTAVCNEFIAPGLDFGDFVGTETDIVVAAAAVILYPLKVLLEPAVLSYALKAPPS